MISYDQWKKLNESIMPMNLGLSRSHSLGIRGSNFAEEGCDMPEEMNKRFSSMESDEDEDEDDMESDEDDMESNEDDMESNEDDMESYEDDMESYEDDMESDEDDMESDKYKAMLKKGGFEESIVSMMNMEHTHRKIK